MARYYGSSAERGYGTAHQRLRRQLMAKWRPGDPCARCGRPMWDKKAIDLGHTDDRTGYRGLEHSFCNRKAGAGHGNTARGQATMVKFDGRQGAPCATCGQHYRHPAQACVICGGHFHPNNSRVQYACSRPCGGELRRRNMVQRGWQPRTICACGNTKSKNATRCARCREAMATEAALRHAASIPGPHTTVSYYTCRYCGKLGTAHGTNQRREVCPARTCQLARLQANNLIARNGITREEADARMRTIVLVAAGEMTATVRRARRARLTTATPNDGPGETKAAIPDGHGQSLR